MQNPAPKKQKIYIFLKHTWIVYENLPQTNPQMFQQISKNNYTDHTLNNYAFKFENKITKNSTRLLKTKKKTKL